MARTPRWKESTGKDGYVEVELSSWKYFHDYVYQRMLQARSYIWRGQRNDTWKLASTLDRALAGRSGKKLREKHLEDFKLSVRGRRGPNPPNTLLENDWWALGQHYGLATPLLDWTTSPFTAAYFAFAQKKTPQAPRRAIWALATFSTLKKSEELRKAHTTPDRPPIVEIIRPMSDENARLVSQGGLFTRSPDGLALDDWVRSNFPGTGGTMILVKFTVPNSDREDCLRSLNRMNINHLSLFPDLYGASAFCNLNLEIPNY
jgi:FRG domain